MIDIAAIMLQVCLKLGQLQRTLCPPLSIGPPPGEISLMPLLEVLRPDNLVALFAAVLLEQRVLLRVSDTQHHCTANGTKDMVRLLAACLVAAFLVLQQCNYYSDRPACAPYLPALQQSQRQ